MEKTISLYIETHQSLIKLIVFLDIDQPDEVNEAVNTITIGFRSTLDKHAVLKQKRVKINCIQPVWFTTRIRTVILARNKAKRKAIKKKLSC